MNERRREQGMALLLVLVVVALLTSLVTDLAHSTLVDMRLTETFRDNTKAYYLAKGGINAGRMILQIDDNPYDSLKEPWSQGIVSYPVGEGSVSIFIMDQDGRLNVNGLVKGDNPQTVMVDRFYRFLVAMDLGDKFDPAELTASLIDWLDTGDDPYAEIRTDEQSLPVSGAEDVYYQSLSPAYRCKNGPLETLQELTLIKGFTSELVQKIRPHLTINSVSAVNINTAGVEVLMSLDLKIDRAIAQKIVDFRQTEPIQSIVQLEGTFEPNTYAVLKTLANLKQLDTKSNIYHIEAHAYVNDGNRRLMAEVNKTNNKLLFFKVN